MFAIVINHKNTFSQVYAHGASGTVGIIPLVHSSLYKPHAFKSKMFDSNSLSITVINSSFVFHQIQDQIQVSVALDCILIPISCLNKLS